MSRNSHSWIRLAGAVAILFAGSFATSGWSQTQPDNTKANKHDRSGAAKTADSQAMNSGDTETTQKIRKAIMEDKSLSIYAHNVKVITRNGTVTLKGPVRTEDERAAIEAKAKEVAGADKVTSQISVAPQK